jgi:hypothetical protein
MKSKLAITSFVLSLISFLDPFLLYFLNSPGNNKFLIYLSNTLGGTILSAIAIPILSIILATISLVQIRRNRDLEGKGYAISAIIIDVLFLGLAFLIAYTASRMFSGVVG